MKHLVYIICLMVAVPALVVAGDNDGLWYPTAISYTATQTAAVPSDEFLAVIDEFSGHVGRRDCPSMWEVTYFSRISGHEVRATTSVLATQVTDAIDEVMRKWRGTMCGYEEDEACMKKIVIVGVIRTNTVAICGE